MSDTANNASFVKCYLNLLQLFDPAEMAFMMNMVYLEHLNQRGIHPNWSKTFLMKKMRMGEKVFKRCEKRFTELGLLNESQEGKRKHYRWNGERYEKLLRIVNASANIFHIEKVCQKFFILEKRKIDEIPENEVISYLNSLTVS